MQPVRTLSGLQWRPGGATLEKVAREAPEEAVLGVSYDSEPYAVLMTTPADLEDLALGFTVTERVVSAADVLDIRLAAHSDGYVADVLLSRAGHEAMSVRRRRTLEARSSCGVCGVQNPQEVLRELPRVDSSLQITHDAVRRALAGLERAQVLGRATRAMHAAGWADPAGELLLVREDVGRHNALDKLVGAAVKAGLDPAQALVVITSRCSYEMVEKTVVAGVGVLAAISAPTALAARMAQAANLTLIAVARGDGHTVFAAPERLNER